MSEHMRADLAAYLLGSLEEDERAAVESHLESCEPCRQELRWLQPAIDLLPESVAQVEPPPRLRERLLAEVGSEAGLEPASEARKRRPASRGFLHGFLLRPATGLAAVALIAAAVAGYALAGSSDSSTTTIPGQPSGTVSATLERKGDSGTLRMTGLRQLPPSKVYEAWVQQGDRIEPTKALFEANRDGTADAAITDQLEGARQVMVTVEPRRGSRQPTGSPVASVKLPG